MMENAESTTEVFLSALRYMAPTIEDVTFSVVSLCSAEGHHEVPSDGSRWAAAFKIMLDCPQLEDLVIDRIYEDGADAAEIVEDQDSHSCETLYLDNHEQIQQSLRLNLEYAAKLFA